MHRHPRRHLRTPLAAPHYYPHEATFQRRMRILLFVGIASALGSALFVTVDAQGAPAAASSADAANGQAKAACRAANQDQVACLKEAGAAKTEAKRGTLADGASPQTREVNAVKRCNALPQKDRADCMARIDGPSDASQRVTTSGSVAGGGVIRETVKTIPGPASEASSGAKRAP